MAEANSAGPDPALIFLDRTDRPGTHVLLVGIGDYPWLEEGSKYVAEEHEEGALGMGQLAAPPISMRNLADWFLDSFQNPERPLASVSLILSEKSPAKYEHARRLPNTGAVPRGTLDEVRKAVIAWSKRASGRRENSLVFGFCGHGLQAGNPVLLCRDYNEDAESRFQGAIDFEQFRIALSTRQPDTQLILVDACRIPDLDDAQLGQATPGNPLIDLQSLTKRDNAPALQSVQFATSLYTEAWGRDEGPSLFTEALLKGLDGGAAEMTADWWVTSSRLHTVLTTYLARASSAEGVVQRPAAAQSQDFRICKPGPIAVDVYVSSVNEPAVWQERWRLKAMRPGFEKEFIHVPAAQPDPDFKEWKLRLINPTQQPADVIYNVHANFDQGSAFKDCVEPVIAYPPEVTCFLPVSKRP
ncbi:caspase family protein [Sphingomonas sp. RT2P30]|uniref:caspase family protein n=1 Tax=Parasphingomonas halimpatiens TaxID=3096162 RepID=UPI002FC99C92